MENRGSKALIKNGERQSSKAEERKSTSTRAVVPLSQVAITKFLSKYLTPAQNFSEAMVARNKAYTDQVNALNSKREAELAFGNVDEANNPTLRSTVLVPCELNVPSSQRFSLFHKRIGNMIDIAIS